MKKILFVSTSFPADASDWRGVFIRHVSEAIARQPGVQLRLWAPPGEVAAVVRRVTDPQAALWLSMLMDRGGISHWLRSKPFSGLLAAGTLLNLMRRGYRQQSDIDAYHLNWLQCALPLPRDGRPVVIAVLGNDMRLMRIPFMRVALRAVLRGRNATICPNASWMVESLRHAFGDLASIVPVAFGIDPCWYAIRRSDASFRSPRCWIVVSRLTAAKLGPLFEWSEPLFRSSERELHLFGPMQEQIEVPSWVRYHGPVGPEQLAKEWFPRATGLLTLSRHAEGRPQVMLEAMAAGLPIIASRMPAHEDIVEDGVTGALCGSAGEYATALQEIEVPSLNLRQGASGRCWARREMGTWDDCALRYSRIYDGLLAASTDG